MSRKLSFYLTLACGIGAAFVPTLATAATATVDSTASIFNYSYVAIAGAAAPDVFTLGSGTGRTLSFTSVTGSVILNNGSGSNSNDPDGIGSVGHNNNPGIFGTAGISGITAPNAGYLVGVFLNGQEGSPTESAPSPLDFTVVGTNFTSLTPLTDQVFFIGDGLTGDGTGTTQQFMVPDGATELALGLVDAPGYNGFPGAYEDNSGSFTVDFNVPGVSTASTPEPASLGILGLGLAAVALIRRRKSVE